MNERRAQIEPYGEDMWLLIGYEGDSEEMRGYYPDYDEAMDAADFWLGDAGTEPEMPSLSNPPIDLNLLADIVYGLIEVTNRIDRQVQAIEGLTKALGGLLLRPEKEGEGVEQ